LTNYSTHVTDITFEISNYKIIKKISRNFFAFKISTINYYILNAPQSTSLCSYGRLLRLCLQGTEKNSTGLMKVFRCICHHQPLALVKDLLFITSFSFPTITPHESFGKGLVFTWHSPRNFHIVPFFSPQSFKSVGAEGDCSVPPGAQSSRWEVVKI